MRRVRRHWTGSSNLARGERMASTMPLPSTSSRRPASAPKHRTGSVPSLPRRPRVAVRDKLQQTAAKLQAGFGRQQVTSSAPWMAHTATSAMKRRPKSAASTRSSRASSRDSSSRRRRSSSGSRPASAAAGSRAAVAAGKPTEEAVRIELARQQAVLDRVSSILRHRVQLKRSLRGVFRGWDQNHDGYISREELSGVLDALGVRLLPMEERRLDAVFQRWNGRLYYDNFVDMVYGTRGEQSALPRGGMGEIRGADVSAAPDRVVVLHECDGDEAFELLQQRFRQTKSPRLMFRKWDADADTALSRAELSAVLSNLGLVLNAAALDQFFAHFKLADDGSAVRYGDFMQAITAEPPSARSPRKLAWKGGGETPELPFKRRRMDGGLRDSLRISRMTAHIIDVITANSAIVRDGFHLFDHDGDGAVTYAEFRATLSKLHLGLTDEETELLMSYIDDNGDGVIDYAEFAAKFNILPEEEAKEGTLSKLDGSKKLVYPIRSRSRAEAAKARIYPKASSTRMRKVDYSTLHMHRGAKRARRKIKDTKYLLRAPPDAPASDFKDAAAHKLPPASRAIGGRRSVLLSAADADHKARVLHGRLERCRRNEARVKEAQAPVREADAERAERRVASLVRQRLAYLRALQERVMKESSRL
eukprot:PLAT3121.1.p1 GENE.PLAT3121.1~~PLAT3121.1.p1  ORF type:complete len:665 (-),score=275.77 PLAT3121.1:234-2177(-)